MALDGPWCYGRRAAVRSGKTVREEGQAMMHTASKQCVLAVPKVRRRASRYGGHMQCFTRDLLVSPTKVPPECLKVKYRHVALSQTQTAAAGGGGARGYQTGVSSHDAHNDNEVRSNPRSAYQMTC